MVSLHIEPEYYLHVFQITHLEIDRFFYSFFALEMLKLTSEKTKLKLSNGLHCKLVNFEDKERFLSCAVFSLVLDSVGVRNVLKAVKSL